MLWGVMGVGVEEDCSAGPKQRKPAVGLFVEDLLEKISDFVPCRDSGELGPYLAASSGAQQKFQENPKSPEVKPVARPQERLSFSNTSTQACRRSTCIETRIPLSIRGPGTL